MASSLSILRYENFFAHKFHDIVEWLEERRADTPLHKGTDFANYPAGKKAQNNGKQKSWKNQNPE